MIVAKENKEHKITITFKTRDITILNTFKMLVNDKLAFEIPKGHFHLIHLFEEYQILTSKK